MALMAAAPALTIQSIPGLPIIKAGDDLAALIAAHAQAAGLTFVDGDILVITSKIVSKSEGRRLDLRTITPSPQAFELAEKSDKDPREVELVLRESSEVSRVRKGAIVVRHKLGFTSANAGIDHSNVGADGEEWVLLLPADPDHSAAQIRAKLRAATGATLGIVISDTHGRPHRLGNIGVAIGVAGVPAWLDLRGKPDLFGRQLQHTDIGLADEIAAAADLLSGQADEGLPVTLIRGLKLPPIDGKASDLYRKPEFDMYR
jgi:coenzyme F420-0:L-glutamate ligase/coenzyme F420-1:gamma-L-glutamate ligase